MRYVGSWLHLSQSSKTSKLLTVTQELTLLVTNVDTTEIPPTRSTLGLLSVSINAVIKQLNTEHLSQRNCNESDLNLIGIAFSRADVCTWEYIQWHSSEFSMGGHDSRNEKSANVAQNWECRSILLMSILHVMSKSVSSLESDTRHFYSAQPA